MFQWIGLKKEEGLYKFLVSNTSYTTRVKENFYKVKVNIICTLKLFEDFR